MKKIIILCTLLIASLGLVAADEMTTKKEKYTFLLVHGASVGGWDWQTIAKQLTAKGHTVYRPTLTGLGEKYHLASPEINLTTHINDVVNIIVFEKLYNIILVGHSYGGMVITGVMDRLPERIQHLDAMVPDDGMSVTDIFPLSSDRKVINGQIYFPWLDENSPLPRDLPQSLKTQSLKS
jgi:pimeloyl-ACP methyl ester carboxylesterase